LRRRKTKMHKVKLYTSAGEFVVEIEIPHFGLKKDEPMILIWGERFFLSLGPGKPFNETFTYFSSVA
jgi:hypothetical protein